MPNQIVEPNSAAPPTLDHVIGQKRAVRQIRTALDAHFADRADADRGQTPALEHCLLVGPPGVGKSLLSGIIARELGADLHEELAQNIISPAHLHGLMMMVEAGDCVFVDEIHELHSIAQTTLYRCLEERRLFLQTGSDQKGKSISLPPFTFIGATTDEWSLTKALRDRFRIILRLEFYDDQELAELITQRARRLGWAISDEAVDGIAARSRGTPRLALRLLDASRRTARSVGESSISSGTFHQMCEIEGIDALGLDPVEQKYLQVLADAQGSPVRLNMLATRLGLPRRTIEQVIENDLIRLGLVSKSDAGRLLTAKGIDHVHAPNQRAMATES